ncbi:FAD-dependent oxidoreductase [Maricaulis sp. D1M11]|uniref:FAD-dependent oxidoreductase n=1 Tax=Maricaulis sp. D1M11 TaxID=3076117 RepID=UPI0039B452AD
MSPSLHVLICGGGFEAVLTACHLAQAVSPAVKVTLMPTVHDDRDDWAYLVLDPEPAAMLRTLGVSDPLLISRCRFNYRLGTRLDGFPGQTASHYLPLGGIGEDWGGTGFLHHWRRLSPDATLDDYYSYSPAVLAMKSGRFAPADPRNRVGTLQHETGLHIQPRDVTALLLHNAKRLGVTVLDQGLDGIERTDTGEITHLRDTSGTVHAADLFVDATGRQSRLGGREDWQGPPPVYLSSHHVEPVDPRTEARLTAREDGWTLDITTGSQGHTFFIDDQPGKSQALAIQTGHALTPWTGNVVRVGQAGLDQPVLIGLAARALLEQVETLIKLLPAGNAPDAERAEYNRLAVERGTALADLSAIYEAARHAQLNDITPPHLAVRTRLFGHRGHVVPDDAPILEAADWTRHCLAVGLFPRHHDPLSERLPTQELTRRRAELRQTLERVVAEFPPHEAFLSMMIQTARKMQGMTA